MKRFILLLLISFCVNPGNAQLLPSSKTVTTTTLPEGTSVKNGKIILLPGYRATYGEKDKKIIIIQRTTKRMIGGSGGSGITGSFSCLCAEDNTSGDCAIITSGPDISCSSGKCKCYMTVVINPKAGMAITRETKGETWKRFVFPVKKQ